MDVANTGILFIFTTCSQTHKIRQKPSSYTELRSLLGGPENTVQGECDIMILLLLIYLILSFGKGPVIKQLFSGEVGG